MSEQMRQWGRARSGTPAALERIDASIERAKGAIEDPATPQKKRESATRTLKKQEASKQVVSSLSEDLIDADVTLDTAAQRRTDLTRDSARRAIREAPIGLGGGSRLRAAGAGWYFDHHADLDATAKQHGVDTSRLITASAVMSPQNSPDNEKAAASALAELHSTNPVLSFGKKAQKHLGLSSGSVKYSDLTSEQAGKLGAVDIREDIEGVGADVLDRLAKGGAHNFVATAVDVIRGNIHPDEAIDPHSAPKVWSYRDSIAKSVPGTPEHSEYMSRADNALFQIPGQQRLDLFGLKSSTEGILSPTKTTAEDTWQGAISSGQQLKSVPIEGSVHPASPAKVVASDKAFIDQITKTAQINGKRVSALRDPAIGASALTHAWHNEATVRSAQQLSDDSGEIVPSVLPQEAGWTEARRVAGKDPAYRRLNAGQFSKGDGNQLSLF